MDASPDIFLSYAREDLAAARVFADALQRAGFSVWWDQTLSTGAAYDQVTEQALESARAVVVLWSRTSVNSRWVRAEATTADRAGTLMPVMIEACKRPVMFELTQAAELVHWKGDANDPAWRTFVADLHNLMQRGSLNAASAPAAPAPAVAATARRPRSAVLLLALAGAAALVAGGWIWQRAAAVRNARNVDIPAIAALVDAGDLSAAFARAAKIQRLVPDDAQLQSLVPQFTVSYDIASTPVGAEVHVRGFGAGDETWQHLGHTPLKGVKLPRRAQRWRLEKPGFATAERATNQWLARNPDGTYRREPVALDVTLQPAGQQPADMVHVPGGSSVARFGQPETEVPAFFISRHEVTNAEFKEFVDAGGYERRSLWEDLGLQKAGKPLAIEDAWRSFVDSNGRPGPATWELGSYPDGTGELPVRGVSWYEAQAYARFRGRSLPTLYHWLRAAFADSDGGNLLAITSTRASNFDAPAPAPVGRLQGMGPYGTLDLFGNAREWIQNPGPGGGWVLGGSWEDPVYMFSVSIAQELLARDPKSGFRLMQEISPPMSAALRAPISMPGRNLDPAALAPVSDQTFALLRSQLAYRSGATNPTAAVTVADSADWTQQRVTIDAGYNGERMDLILFVPKRARPPFQPLVFFPGSDLFTQPAASKDIRLGALDHFVKSGRLLVQPIFQGSYERMKEPLNLADMIALKRLMLDWRSDLGRTIDYLESRPDVDAGQLGYVGYSFGGSTVVPLLAVEPRIKTAVLVSGGWWVPLGWTPAEPLLNPANFAPRITMPVLMLSGRFDELFTVEGSQLPLMRLLGAAIKDKQHVLVDEGHGPQSFAAARSETLGWLDRYLGEPRH
jgi:eukaryotic-like serine/threonine-protein kinase